MVKNEFFDNGFKDLLLANDEKADFNALWNRQDPWFEEPNIGRRDSKTAWSGVARISFNNRAFFLKKQEDYFTYSVKPPLRQLIAQKEYKNIKLFESLNIPCLEVVYFGIRKSKKGLLGKSQGIIITKALDNYVPFDKAMDMVNNTNEPDKSDLKKALIEEVALLVSRTHRAGLMHRCLYPKHIYIQKNFCATGKKPAKEPVCRFIDLESARKVPYQSRRQLRDLETLNRRTIGISPKEKEIFLLKYLNKTEMDHEVMDLVKRVQKISR